MNRFLRTAYWTSFVYLLPALIVALATGRGMPFPAFVCLYFGLLVGLLPVAAPKLSRAKTAFALLGALIALAGLLPIYLYRCGIAHYVVYGVCLAAALLLCGLLKHRTTHSDFTAKFRFCVVLIVLCVAAMYIILLIGVTDQLVIPLKRENVKTAVEHAVPVAIMLLVTGVLLLRGLRDLQCAMNEKEFTKRQIRDVVIYASVVSAVFMASPLFLKGVAWLMNNAVIPAWRGFLKLLSKLLELLANKNPNFYHDTVAATAGPSEAAPTPPSYMFVDKDPEHYVIDESNETGFYNTLLYIFAAIAAAVLLAILIVEARKLIIRLRERISSRGRGYPNEIRESLDGEQSVQKTKKPRKHSADPRLRIRYLYREYLKLLGRAHVPLKPSDTCGEINESAERVLRTGEDELSELRGLYEQARYSEKDALNDGDASRMKALYDKVKKDRS